MKEALFYESCGNGEAYCGLCPHNCLISNGHTGNCNARSNKDGVLFTEIYGKVVSLNFDPIEKKPFYHFCPGSHILSLGTFGCNFHCDFCQNSEISQPEPGSFININDTAPEVAISVSLSRRNNTGLAFTYNEPAIWYEYIMDTAKLSHEKGLRNVMVTNGYINEEPLKQLLQYIDAFNVDIKSFNNHFYMKYTSANIEPVKKNIIGIKKADRHLELTFLAIPGLNDAPGEFAELTKWIESEAGSNTILHINRYFPSYKMNLEPTPYETLERLYNIAASRLDYVYIGNTREAELSNDTKCCACKNPVIKRNCYNVSLNGLDDKGYCKYCNNKVAIC